MPTHTATHIAKAPPANAESKALSKSVSVATHGLRNCSKYECKMTEKNQHQAVTKCINHWAVCAGFKGVTLNKICSGLTGKCFEMPNASYTNR
jgi:hypothetical protein